MRVVCGIGAEELMKMPFSVIRRICELKEKESRAERGEWSDLDSIPEPENPDGPPPRDQFVAYAWSVGGNPAWANAEYDRQVKDGGFGETRGVDGKPF